MNNRFNEFKPDQIRPKDQEVVEQALKHGCRLHGFLASGGLRVLSLTRKGVKKELGYGEHPDIVQAFRILAEDYEAGGRPYKKVYGPIEIHYRTGSSNPSGQLDAVLRTGGSLDAWYKKDSFEVALHSHYQVEIPEQLEQRVMSTGVEETWTDRRGVVFRIQKSRFPSGESCLCTTTIHLPDGIPSWQNMSWPCTQTASRSESFLAAAFDALEAEPVLRKD